MKSTEIRERTSEELVELKADLRRKLWKLRFDNYSNQLDNTSQIPKLRRNLARIHTILTERQQRTE